MPADKTRPTLKMTILLSTGRFSFHREKNAGKFVDFSWVKNEKPLEIKRFFGCFVYGLRKRYFRHFCV